MPAMRVSLEDLPPAYRRQAEAQLAFPPQKTFPDTYPTEQGSVSVPKVSPRQWKLPNQTEGAFRRLHIPHDAIHVRYSLISVNVAGHRYTPDWTWYEGGRLHAAEVKGTYRHASHGRSRLAYDQARIDYPEIAWVWAEMQEDGSFELL